jgi:hypothetical protein
MIPFTQHTVDHTYFSQLTTTKQFLKYVFYAFTRRYARLTGL